MKIPKEIKVGAITFDVKIVDSLENDELGRTTFSKQEMLILKGKQQQMEETFLHELFHTFAKTFNEKEVDVLANRLHAFIKDNKGVLNE